MEPTPQTSPESLNSSYSKDTQKEGEIYVQIPPTDFNDTSTSPALDSVTTSHKGFTSDVFDNLPQLLREGCDAFVEDTEKEVFLVGALGIVSGILPNVMGYYAGDEIPPNLYVYLLGNYGQGKGSLRYAKKLAEPIHAHMKAEAEAQKQEQEAGMHKYNKKLKEFQKDKKEDAKPPEKPEAAPILMHFIPANSSKSGIIQLLNENDGRGTIFETEGDTLADALKQDYGGFSDALRKAFHSESISLFRRTDSESIHIDKPCVSVVLSSTFDQLTALMPSPQNGLFSRFLYYVIQPDPVFKDVFDSRKKGYEARFKALGEKYFEVYQALQSLSDPIEFSLEADQQEEFLRVFQKSKDELIEYVGQDINGTVNRLGVICFRVAMLLSALRMFEDGVIETELLCTQADFENALRIVEILKDHAMKVYYSYPPPTHTNRGIDKAAEKLLQKEQCLRLHEQGHSVRTIAKMVLGDEKQKSTVHRWIKE